jgi:hypothetical protein
MFTDAWANARFGHDDLHVATVDTIRKARPLRKVPSGLPDQFSNSMPVTFNLP